MALRRRFCGWLIPISGAIIFLLLCRTDAGICRNGGVDVRFYQHVTGVLMRKGRCAGVRTEDEEYPADCTFLAPGHSAFPLFRSLSIQGAQFQSKGFSLGFRIEHPRELINRAQWGRASVPGLKAAEYQLSGKAESGRGIYTFCMCPGGQIVPAAWKEWAQYCKRGFHV